jgi:hypothetical protein
MGHPQIDRLKRRLSNSQAKRVDAESKLKQSELKLADAEAKLEESKRVIAALQTSKASLQDTLQQSINKTDMGKLARQACVEEIKILRQRSGGEIQETLESLEEGEAIPQTTRVQSKK